MHQKLSTFMLCYLLSASDRCPTHQSSDTIGVSLSAFSGLNDAGATPTSDHIDQPQQQASGSSANQQQPEESATIPNHVLISKHQENNVSSSAPLHFVAIPMTYSRSVDMFCQIHPTHLSNMSYPLAPMLVPLTYTGSAPSSHAQRPNDAVFMPANLPHFLGPSPVGIHTPASCLPVFSAARGLDLSHGSDSSLFQNQAAAASSDPAPVYRPAASDSTEPPSIRLSTAERYFKLGMFY